MAETSRMLTTVERLLIFFEKNRFNLVTGSLLLLCFMTVRGYIEFTFFNRDAVTGLIGLNIYNVVAQGLSMYLAFLAGTYILCVFSKERARRVANTILLGMAAIMMGPLVDRYVFGRTERYEFIWIDDLGGTGAGLTMQLMIIVTLGAVYVGVKTENLKRAVFTFLSLLGIMFAIGVIPYAVFRSLGMVFGDDATQTAAAILTLPFILVFAIAILRIRNEDAYWELRRNLKMKMTLSYILAAFLGIIAAGRMLFSYGQEAVTIEVDDIPFAALLLISTAFVAQSGFLMERAADVKHPDAKTPPTVNLLNHNQYSQLAVLMAFLSMGLSMPLGIIPLSLTIMFLVLAKIYAIVDSGSKTMGGKRILLGQQCLTIFFVGYYSTRKTASYEILGFDLAYPRIPSLELSPVAVFFSVSIFIAGMILLPLRNPEYSRAEEKKS